MSKQEDEIRRLQRLRDEQLRARDPLARERATHQRLSAKHRRTRKRTTVWDIIMDFPAKWLYMLIGLLIGVLMALVLNILIQASWSQIVGGVLVVFGLVAGRVFGAIIDWKDEDWG